jgi:hypothetical protein
MYARLGTAAWSATFVVIDSLPARLRLHDLTKMGQGFYTKK